MRPLFHLVTGPHVAFVISEWPSGEGSLSIHLGFNLLRRRHGIWRWCDFSRDRERCSPPKVAGLPIGAYDPRWFMRTQHADPAESVQIAKACGAGHMLGVHWSAFALTDEPFHAPARLLCTAAAEQGVSAQAFRAGDTWEVL